MGKKHYLGILRNPAYIGKACYGKTEQAERKKITKLLRAKGGYSSRNDCKKEKPRSEWIEIPVPAIITTETFDLAAERLKNNKLQSQRNTVEVSLLQGMLICSECGYTLYRTSSHSSTAKALLLPVHGITGLPLYKWKKVQLQACKTRLY